MICSKCGRPMQLRIARRGISSGNYFLGCTGYPACTNTQDVDQKDIKPEDQHEASNRQSGGNMKSADEIMLQLGMRELSRDINQHQHQHQHHRVLKVKAHNSTKEISSCIHIGTPEESATNWSAVLVKTVGH